ncbi:hypothetical protein BAE44_0023530 [Dichanthelium oligosanthes]|uniref:Uncharacterized protein n=1 Tax=Dichanthelium oligosanthes TaxID=888268 RepID=A0A1E5URF4_9POAL|nr:hypothetical protein BAE44_0023530 [Dichanthelium oligosanthes]
MAVDDLGSKGQPIKPPEVISRFRNTCGAIVRDNLHGFITTNNWKKVSDTKKDVLWAKLKESFKFPEGREKFLWKDATKDFERIPSYVWANFVEQKNIDEAKALSDQNSRKAKKNAKNPHHLGVGGYAGKVPKWRKEEEERRLAGLPDVLARLDDRSRNWVLARQPKLTPQGEVRFEKPTMELIFQRLQQISQKRSQGQFKPN